MNIDHGGRWAASEWWLPAAAAALLGICGSWAGAQEQTAGQSNSIHSPRPLLDLVELMEGRYASPVNYEDPIWEFQGDLAPVGPRSGLFPMYRTFAVPPDLTPEQRPKLDAAVLGEALAAYHAQTDGPRYKILTSRLGPSLVPDQVRDAGGALRAARNPLDAVVNIPVAARTPSAHIEALCAELSAASGARIIFMGPSGNYTLERIYMPNGHIGRAGSKEDLTVVWGAQGVVAREALTSLLEPSATTLSWRFVCQVGRNCFIDADALKLPVAMPGGRIGWKAILYDRCTVNCPKLGPPPPPIKK